VVVEKENLRGQDYNNDRVVKSFEKLEVPEKDRVF
jgi:hypothetical protein